MVRFCVLLLFWSDLKTLRFQECRASSQEPAGDRSGKPGRYNVFGLEGLLTALSQYNRTTVFYDHSFEEWPTVLHEMGSMALIAYRIDFFNQFLEHHVRNTMKDATTLDGLKRNLHFLIFCEECIQHVLSHAANVDRQFGLRCLLRHFSTWFIVTNTAVPKVNSVLDNVAVLQIHEETRCCQETENVRYDSIFTLTWSSEGRLWTPIHTSHLPDTRIYSAVFPNTLAGLNGRPLVLATLQFVPFTMLQPGNPRLTYVGAGIDVVNILAKTFNFTITFVEPKDQAWGTYSNGTWNGIVKMIQDGEADMCPCQYIRNYLRSQAMDFTGPMASTDYYAIFRKRKDHRDGWTFLLTRFRWEAVGCMLVAVLCITTLYTSLDLPQNMRLGGINYICRSLTLIGLRIPLRQDILHDESPRGMPGMLVLFSWCAFCVIVMSIYSGSLVAMATIERYEIPFSTLDELSKHDDYMVGGINGDFGLEAFMTSTDATYKAVYKKMKNNVIPGDASQLNKSLDLLLNNNFVMITGSLTRRILESRSCEITAMKEKLFSAQKGLTFPPHSPLRKLFDEKLLYLSNIGVIDRISEKWLGTSAKPCYDNSRQTNQFKMDNIKTVFFLGLGGIVLAAIVLCGEIMKHNQTI